MRVSFFNRVGGSSNWIAQCRNLITCDFLGPLDLVTFLMLDLMLERVPQIMQRFVRHQFRRECVIERRQDALLDFIQRNRVIGRLARNFRRLENSPEIPPDRFASHEASWPSDLLDEMREEIVRCETQPKLLPAL